MKNVIGLWNIYAQGEVYKTLSDLISYFLKMEGQLHIELKESVWRINDKEDILKCLRQHEKEKGLMSLLNDFEKGIQIVKTDAAQKINSTITLFMRFPTDHLEKKGQFKEMIVEEVKTEGGLFIDKYFREPVHIMTSSPLQRAIHKMFGFGFEYKILIEGKLS